MLQYPDDWTDAWTVQALHDVTEPLWSAMGASLDFEYLVRDDCIAGVAMQQIRWRPAAGVAIVHLHGGMFCLGSPTIDATNAAARPPASR